MPGYFGYISTDIDCLKDVDITDRLDLMGNCRSKIVKQPGFFLACLWPKEASLEGNFIFEDDRWAILFDGDLVDGPIPLEDEGVPWKKILDIFAKESYLDFQDLRGLFSIAAFNKKARSLFLVTDRIGMSPLYYLKLPHGFWFSTSLSAFYCLKKDFKINFRYIYD